MDAWLKSAIDYIGSWIEFQQQLFQQPGVIVAVSHRGEVVAEYAFGLANLDKFHWVVGLSSALVGDSVAAPFANMLSDSAKVNRALKLLYLTIGKDDGLARGNRAFDAALTSAGIRHIYREGEGAHTWRVWRRNLNDIAPLLFQPTSRR